MIWLLLGVLLFAGVHMIPAAAKPTRARVIERVGEGPYKGLFALGTLGGIALMVVGWRSSAPSMVYATPSGADWVANLLLVPALILFAASGVPTNLKRVIRHPQLTGVATWAVAHLLANGDSRTILLFGGIGLWAVVEIGFLNRRDGAWKKPEPLPMSAELKPLIGGVVAFALFFFLHPYIAGVSPMPN